MTAFSKRFYNLFSMCMYSECHSISFPVQTSKILFVKLCRSKSYRVDVNKPWRCHSLTAVKVSQMHQSRKGDVLRVHCEVEIETISNLLYI